MEEQLNAIMEKLNSLESSITTTREDSEAFQESTREWMTQVQRILDLQISQQEDIDRNLPRLDRESVTPSSHHPSSSPPVFVNTNPSSGSRSLISSEEPFVDMDKLLLEGIGESRQNQHQGQCSDVKIYHPVRIPRLETSVRGIFRSEERCLVPTLTIV